MKQTGLFLLAAMALPVVAAPVIGTVAVSQTTAVISTPTPVTVTASITDPSLIANSVNVVQLNANGTTAVLGILHDDGLNGDKSARDSVFSGIVNLNSSAPAVIQLQVSAAFRGQLQRAKSSVIQILFQSADAPIQSLSALARSLAAGDKTTALTFVVGSDKNTNGLNGFNQQSLNALAAMLQSATPAGTQGDVHFFTAPFVTQNGVSITVEISMVPDGKGNWLVDTW